MNTANAVPSWSRVLRMTSMLSGGLLRRPGLSHGADSATGTGSGYRYQNQAVAFARAIAFSHRVEMVVHDRNGDITRYAPGVIDLSQIARLRLARQPTVSGTQPALLSGAAPVLGFLSSRDWMPWSYSFALGEDFGLRRVDFPCGLSCALSRRAANRTSSRSQIQPE